MPKLIQMLKTRRNIFVVQVACYKALPRGQEGGSATLQQSIYHVRPWNSQFSIEENSKGSTFWKIGRFATKIKAARDHWYSAQKHNCGTIGEGYLKDKQYPTRMHKQWYTQSDMQEFYRRALKWKNYWRSYSWRQALLQRPKQGRTAQSRRQQHREDQTISRDATSATRAAASWVSRNVYQSWAGTRSKKQTKLPTTWWDRSTWSWSKRQNRTFKRSLRLPRGILSSTRPLQQKHFLSLRAWWFRKRSGAHQSTTFLT